MDTLEQILLILELVSPEGFERAFEKELKNHRFYIDAYEAVEEVYYKAYKVRKYANYHAFRMSRKRRLQKNRQAGIRKAS